MPFFGTNHFIFPQGARKARRSLPKHLIGAISAGAALKRSPSGPIARIGGPGSYSETATNKMFGASARVLPCGSIYRCLEAVLMRKAGRAVVPVYNAARGPISDTGSMITVEATAAKMGLVKTRELRLPVRHVIASRGSLDQVRLAFSKMQAIDQCRKFCKRHGITPVHTTMEGRELADTSEAAGYVAGLKVRFVAAICDPKAARHHGLPVLDTETVADVEDNYTVFFVYERAAGNQ